MSPLEFDEAMAQRLEVAYSGRDARRRRALVREALAAQPGERVLDVGCGPGFYEAELLDDVGAEGSIVGIDSSAPMLAMAARRCEGRANVTLAEGEATALPVGDAEFDAAFSVQVLEYVEDIPAALAEIRRALRPGGRAVIWDVDWATISLRTTDEARMRRMLGAWDEHLADPSLPRRLTAELRAAGFADPRMEGHAFVTNELIPDTYGGFVVSFLEQFVIDAGTAPEDVARAWGDEQRELAQRGEFYFAVIQFCFAASLAA
jgi:ubiquinone/menaquinone biosynthesis C-methylase UbiE